MDDERLYSICDALSSVIAGVIPGEPAGRGFAVLKDETHVYPMIHTATDEHYSAKISWKAGREVVHMRADIKLHGDDGCNAVCRSQFFLGDDDRQEQFEASLAHLTRKTARKLERKVRRTAA